MWIPLLVSLAAVEAVVIVALYYNSRTWRDWYLEKHEYVIEQAARILRLERQLENARQKIGVYGKELYEIKKQSPVSPLRVMPYYQMPTSGVAMIDTSKELKIMSMEVVLLPESSEETPTDAPSPLSLTQLATAIKEAETR